MADDKVSNATPKGFKPLTVPTDPIAALQEIQLEQMNRPVGRSTDEGTREAHIQAVERAREDASVHASTRASELSASHASEDESVLSGKRARSRASEPARESPRPPASKRSKEFPAVTRDTRLVLLNTRIPETYSEWLDLEAFQSRKRGVTKQSLVIHAIELLIAESQEHGEENKD